MTFWRFTAMCFMYIAAIAFGCQAASADSVADFYKGKSVTILIAERSAADMMADFYRGKATASLASVQEDSPYDLTGRNAAAFFHKYIPGNPAIAVQNMPGAGGIRGAEYFANEVPRDGTVVLVAAPAIVLSQLLTSSVHYHAERFAWLGRIAPLVQVGFVSATSGIISMKDTKTRDVIFGAEGPTGPSSMIPWALDRLTGSRFKVVRGYAGNTELFIALQRGEIQGMGGIDLNVLVGKGGIEGFNVLYAISDRRIVSLPNVPTLPELGDNERDRSVLRLLASIPDIGISIAAPSKVPTERVAALRAAFAAMVRDQEFIDNERKLEINVDPLGGNDVNAIISRITDTPPDLVEALKTAIEPMN